MTPPLRTRYPIKCPECEGLDTMTRISNPNNLHTINGCTQTYGCKTSSCRFDFAIKQPSPCRDLSKLDFVELDMMGLLPARFNWDVFS